MKLSHFGLLTFLMAGFSTNAFAAQTSISLVSASASAASVTRGQSEVVTTSLKSNAAISNGVVIIKILDANSNVVSEKDIKSVNFSANQASSFQDASIDTSTLAAGAYSVTVGAFSGDFKSTYAFLSNVASFTVTNAATTTPATPAPSAGSPSIALTSTSVSATSVVVGQTESVSAVVKANSAFSNLNVIVRVYNSKQASVGEQDFAAQNLVANQATTYQLKNLSTSSLAAGHYTVTVGVWSSDWSKTYVWQENAASFDVTASSTSAPAPTPSPTPSPVATPAPAASIISLPPSPISSTVISPDSLLSIGTPTTVTGFNAIGINSASNGMPEWVIYANPWGIGSATGQSSVSYTGQGSVQINVNYSNLPIAGVNGYPFIGMGRDVYGYQHGGQAAGAPQFPMQLSAMKSLVLETTHSLTASVKPGDLDIAFDEWLVPNASYSGGQTGAVEVMLMYDYDFAYASACGKIKTFTAPIILNGVSSNVSFDEIKCGTGAGTYVAFVPSSQKLTSANIRVNFLDFMNEAATSSAVGSSWYLSGIQFGTEFGHTGYDSSTTATYQMNITKLQIEQTLK